MPPNRAAKRRAFTLIELIVVILVIGILAVVAVLGYGKYSDHAAMTAAKTQLRQIATAVGVEATSDGASELSRDMVVRALEDHLQVEVHSGQSAAPTWDLLAPDQKPTSSEDFSLAFEDADGHITADAGARMMLTTKSSGGQSVGILVAGPDLATCYVPVEGDAAAEAGDVLARTPYCPRSEEAGSGDLDTTAPSAPLDVTATSSGLDVAVTWSAATDDTGVAGYEIHRSTEVGFTPSTDTKVGFVRGTSFTDTTPTAGAWNYRVVTFDLAGNPTPSAPVQVTTAPSVTIPGAPEPAAELDTTSGTTTVTWPAVAGAAAYVVQWQVDEGALVTSSVEDVSWKRTVSAGQTLSVQVAAENSAGRSPWSQTLSVTRAPGAPILSGDVTQGVHAEVSWSAPAGASSYVVRHAIGEGDWVQSDPTPELSTTLTLEVGTQSTWQVAAVRGTEQGPWSAPLVLTAAPAVPEVAGSLDKDTGRSTLTWQDTAGATSYVTRFAVDDGAWFEIPGSDGSAQRTISAGQTIVWQVAGVNATGRGDWSSEVRHTRSPLSPVLTGSFDQGTRTSDISWPAVASATEYAVRYRVGSSEWVTTTTSARTATKVIAAGQQIVWQVAAVNTGGQGDWSTTLEHLAVPAAPVVTGSLSASSGIAWHRVDWTASAGATSYRCEYSTNSLAWQGSACGTSTLVMSAALSAGDSGIWRVFAENAAGKSDPAYTEQVLTPPAIPVPTESFVTGTRTSTFTWTAGGANVSSYDVQYRINGGTWVGSVVTTPRSATQVIAAGQSIEWQVRGVNAAGNSGWSTTKYRLAVPDAPVLTGSFVDSTGVSTVTWPAVAGATSYQVTPTIDGVAQATVPVTDVSYSRTISNGQTISWSVRSTNTSGNSLTASNTVTHTRKPATPVLATVPATDVYSTKYAPIKWLAVSSATSYTVTYRTDGGTWYTTGTSSSVLYVNVRQSEGELVEFTVAANNVAGSSTPVSGSFNWIAGAPVLKLGTVTASSLNWTWTLPQYGEAAAGFQYRYSTDGVTWGAPTSVYAFAFTKTGLAKGATGYLQVRSRANNLTYGDWSTTVSGVTK